MTQGGQEHLRSPGWAPTGLGCAAGSWPDPVAPSRLEFVLLLFGGQRARPQGRNNLTRRSSHARCSEMDADLETAPPDPHVPGESFNLEKRIFFPLSESLSQIVERWPTSPYL